MLSADAARWALRRATGPLSSDEQQTFEAWLAGDERRAGALLQADATLALVDRAQAVVATADTPRSPARRRVLLWGGALAAGAAGLWFLPDRGALTTDVGEIRRTRLADASTVTLNTQSRVTVDLEPRERALSLDRGEAWFEVAHDRRRPFVVRAADAP